MAIHKTAKPKKKYKNNWTLYPGFRDKFLIQYNKDLKCWRVVHYSRFSFRGQWNMHGTRSNGFAANSVLRRNDWEYQRVFNNEIEAMEFAKNKAKQRGMVDAVFLLQMDVDV